MPDSKRERILQAVHSALDAAGKPPGSTVLRLPLAPLESISLPAFALYPGLPGPGLDEEVSRARESSTIGGVNRLLHFTIRTQARDETELDLLSQWVVQSVGGLKLNLDGKGVEILEEGSKWNWAQASDSDRLVLDTLFSARYATRRADLTQ